MINDDVKNNADNMACKIFEYIEVAIPNDKREDKKELYLEIATSFITAAINPESENYIQDIIDACVDCSKMGIVELTRYRLGNKTRVLKELDTNRGEKN